MKEKSEKNKATKRKNVAINEELSNDIASFIENLSDNELKMFFIISIGQLKERGLLDEEPSGSLKKEIELLKNDYPAYYKKIFHNC